MAWLLSIETSTTLCSAALHEDGKVKAVTELHMPQSAASRLGVAIDELLKLCDINPRQVEGVAVSAGPGSYTGLRIGVATAKGFCYASGIPLISVNTLELMASQATDFNFEKAMLCPMLDARRMEVYCLLVDDTLKMLLPTEARVIEEGSFEAWLDKGTVIFFGDGAAKCREVIRHPHARFADHVHPSAARLGELAFRKFEQKNFEDLAAFEPLYLKDFLIRKPKSAE